MWFNILKMPPNPHGGTWSRLSREEYYQMDDENKSLYHSSQREAHQKILNELRMRLSNESDLNRKSPMLEELKVLQLKRNFHSRQASRTKIGTENYYSLEDEGQNRIIQRLITRPEGTKLEDLTEEEYNKASTREKRNFHAIMGRSGDNSEQKRFHVKMQSRLNRTSNLPTFYSIEDDPEWEDEEE